MEYDHVIIFEIENQAVAEEVTICTFNVENLFMRYKIFGYLPADRFKRVKLTSEELAKGWGFLPGLIQKDLEKSFAIFDKGNRRLTADAIKGYGEYKKDNSLPDILCMQEVESLETLRTFNKEYLEEYYKYAVLVDSHDPRLIDVGVLSNHPIRSLATHIDELYDGELPKQKYLFSRDCLEVDFEIGSKNLTVFINHLKSKYSDSKDPVEKAQQEQRSNTLRLEQAQRVHKIVTDRFKGEKFTTENFVVLGDFNDTADSPYIKPITQDLGMVNVLARLDENKRWTHWWESKNTVSQLDHILVSPNLSKNSPNTPYIERRGISKKIKKKSHLNSKDGEDIPFDFERFEGVSDKIEASDHCPVFSDLVIK